MQQMEIKTFHNYIMVRGRLSGKGVMGEIFTATTMMTCIWLQKVTPAYSLTFCSLQAKTIRTVVYVREDINTTSARVKHLRAYVTFRDKVV